MREEKRKEEMQNRQQLEELRSERDSLRESIIGFQCTIKKFESDRDDLVRCLEEARKRITGICHIFSIKNKSACERLSFFYFQFWKTIVASWISNLLTSALP